MCDIAMAGVEVKLPAYKKSQLDEQKVTVLCLIKEHNGQSWICENAASSSLLMAWNDQDQNSEWLFNYIIVHDDLYNEWWSCCIRVTY